MCNRLTIVVITMIMRGGNHDGDRRSMQMHAINMKVVAVDVDGGGYNDDGER